MKRLVLLDSHAILHRAYHALPDFMSKKGEPTGALYGLATMLINIIHTLKPDYIVACYDLPGPTYRHEVYKEYKAGRKKTDEALVAQLIRSRDIFHAFGIPIYDTPGFEADDMLGTIVEQLKGSEDITTIIASGDMDTLQLVDGSKVQVYTLKKGIKDTILYDEDKVRERFGFGPKLIPDYKGLRGDTSDNIIGIKGIGEKTGATLIQTFGSIENMYKVLKKDTEPFIKAGITPRIIELLKNGEEEAMFSKTLALIRRDAPIKFEMPRSWKECVDLTKIDALFSELEFRMLGTRVREAILGIKPASKKASVAASGTADGESTEGGEDAQGQAVLVEAGMDVSAVDPLELKKTLVALWLLDSNLSNPAVSDLENFTSTKDFAAARDAVFGELKKRNLDKVFEDIELPLMPVIDKMEKRGIKIDVDYLKKLGAEYHAVADKLEKEIWSEAGMEFNINSPKQLGEVLFDKMGLSIKNAKKTAGGARSTKESELLKLKDTHPIINSILEYRELQKLLGTYIDTIPGQVDTDGRLHTTMLQTGSTTGRMASHNPNLQNIPIKTELGRRIRNAFIAEKGFVLASLDYSQIELRVAAFLSGDAKLIEIFKSGGDIHSAVASEVFKVPVAEVTPEMRRRAKVINFGVMYGMGVTALKANLGAETTRAEAQLFYNNYFETFSGLATYLDKVKAEAARLGYTETFFGRRRYFEGIKSRIPFIRAMAERMAINAPIQGTEADIIKLAMIRVDEFLTKEGLEEDAHLLLQVHDELIYELREDKAEMIAKRIEHIMENVVAPESIQGIVCVAEHSLGQNWGEI